MTQIEKTSMSEGTRGHGRDNERHEGRANKDQNWRQKPQAFRDHGGRPRPLTQGEKQKEMDGNWKEQKLQVHRRQGTHSKPTDTGQQRQGGHTPESMNRRRKSGAPRQENRYSGDSRKCALENKGAQRLLKVLSNDFRICPRRDANPKHGTLPLNPLPNLCVKAEDLINYVVEHLSEMEKEGKPIECQIYGGEARAIVAAEYDVDDPKSRPTDLDLRFKIGSMGFEECREVVKDFLYGRLASIYPEGDTQRQVIRQHCFQKQVVVGSDFSLLSIGDPNTGRNLDLEFTTSECQARCFFDDANAFIIPLPDLSSIKAGRGPELWAQSLSANVRDAVHYIETGQLNIYKPEDVFNGLPLYAHALTDTRLTPGSPQLEAQYGAKFAGAFLEQAEASYVKGEDPLRFIKSFLRSHYPSRAVNALACLSQMLAVLRAHAANDVTQEREAIAMKLAESLADLCIEALHNAHRQAKPEREKAVQNVLKIANFAAHPYTNSKGRNSDDRVRISAERTVRLRRQASSANSKVWEEVCKHSAEVLAEKQVQDANLDDNQRTDVGAVCEALKHSDTPRSDAGVSRETSAEDDSDEEQAIDSVDDDLDMKCTISSRSTSPPSIMDSETSSSSPSENCEDEAGEDVTFPSTPSLGRVQTRVQVDVDSPEPSTDEPSTVSPAPSSARTPNSGNTRRPNSSSRPNWQMGTYRPPGSRRSTASPGSPKNQEP